MEACPCPAPEQPAVGGAFRCWQNPVSVCTMLGQSQWQPRRQPADRHHRPQGYITCTRSLCLRILYSSAFPRFTVSSPGVDDRQAELKSGGRCDIVLELAGHTCFMSLRGAAAGQRARLECSSRDTSTHVCVCCLVRSAMKSEHLTVILQSMGGSCGL